MTSQRETPLQEARRLLREIRFIYNQENKRAAEMIEAEGIPDLPPEDTKMLTALGRVPKNQFRILVLLVQEVARLESRVAEVEAEIETEVAETDKPAVADT